MSELHPAAIMAAHADHRADATDRCMLSDSPQLRPCLPYRLAAALAAAQEREQRVEAVRAKVMDTTQHAIEGPLIARIKVDSWLRAALAGEGADRITIERITSSTHGRFAVGEGPDDSPPGDDPDGERNQA